MSIGSDGEMAEIVIRFALRGGAISDAVFRVFGILAVFVQG